MLPCNDAVASPAGETASPSQVERRARVRYRCEPPVSGRAFITNTFRSIPAQVLDLSVEGIGLLVREPLVPGTRLNVELEGPAEATLEVLAEVCAVSTQADGAWRCACALVWKISEDELRVMTQ